MHGWVNVRTKGGEEGLIPSVALRLTGNEEAQG